MEGWVSEQKEGSMESWGQTGRLDTVPPLCTYILHIIMTPRASILSHFPNEEAEAYGWPVMPSDYQSQQILAPFPTQGPGSPHSAAF